MTNRKRDYQDLKKLWESWSRFKELKAGDPGDNSIFTDLIDRDERRVSEEVFEKLDQIFGKPKPKALESNQRSEKPETTKANFNDATIK